jgi:hypothetical protein
MYYFGVIYGWFDWSEREDSTSVNVTASVTTHNSFFLTTSRTLTSMQYGNNPEYKYKYCVTNERYNIDIRPNPLLLQYGHNPEYCMTILRY